MSHAAEPMMDNPVLDTSRVGAFNSARDGGFAGALKAEEEALKIAGDKYGNLHPALVPILDDLGTLHRTLADYPQSEMNYKWGLALLEKNFGADDPRVADSLDLLAALYRDLNRLSEAELILKRSLSLREKNKREIPRALAQTLGLLGRVEQGRGNLPAALALFLRAQECLDKDPKPDTLQLISLSNDLAEIRGEEKNDSQAEACLEKSLAIAKNKFSTAGIEVTDAMLKLADFYHARHQDEKAGPLYVEALKISQSLVGTYYDYPALPYMKKLARAYQRAGNFEKAGDLWQKSLQTEIKVFGPQHPRIALGLINLAEVKADVKRNAKARQDLQQSLGILKNFFPGDHPLVVLVQEKLEKLSR